jgi:membrane-associated phospholipid phosphatase
MKRMYQISLGYLKEHDKLLKIVRFLNKTITKVTYLAYILLVCVKLWVEPWQGIKILYVAGIPYLILSFFRTKINTRRPYEVYSFTPLIARKSNGKSFPSRHVFSIFIIATLLYFQYCWLGVIFYGLGILLAIIRVVTGVHFPKDVVVGAIIGVLSGVVLWNI